MRLATYKNGAVGPVNRSPRSVSVSGFIVLTSRAELLSEVMCQRVPSLLQHRRIFVHVTRRYVTGERAPTLKRFAQKHYGHRRPGTQVRDLRARA